MCHTNTCIITGQIPIDKLAILEDKFRWIIGEPFMVKHPNQHIAQYAIFFSDLTAHYPQVVLSATRKLNPELYLHDIMYNKLRISSCIGNVGRSSYQVVHSCWSEKSGALLYEAVKQGVFVDTATMKSKVLRGPMKEIIERYKTATPTKKIPNLVKPDKNIYTTKQRVYWSDIDILGHVNNANYLRFCSDAMTEAGLKGLFRSVEGDLGRYWIQNVEILYKGEAKAGDVLDIHVWEDPTKAMLIHSFIEKGAVPVVQCSIQFTDPASPKL